MIFFALLTLDGTLSGTKYVTNTPGICNFAFNIQEYDSKIYLLYYCGKLYITIYDIALDTFTEYIEGPTHSFQIKTTVIDGNTITLYGHSGPSTEDN
jgi:hypothetical protein